VTEPDPAPATGRRRPPPGRISPEAMAAQRGGAVEGLAWLGRQPEAKASILYRVLRLAARFVIFVAFRFRIRTSGQENLPRGGYLLVAAAHRGWMDPFVVMHAIPAQPRAWFLGSAPSTFTSRWRESLIHRLGGLLPVWRGGIGIDQHVVAARAVIANGAVFAQMPEGTVSGPPGRIGAFRTGWAVIAMRTDAPGVPVAIAGTEVLYLTHYGWNGSQDHFYIEGEFYHNNAHWYTGYGYDVDNGLKRYGAVLDSWIAKSTGGCWY
jgi:1-acyl-sn-glycerol-3-phosphate acyltransferase